MINMINTLQDACWQILEQKGLGGLTAEVVAQNSDISLSDVLEACPTDSDFLKLLWADVQSRMPPLPDGLEAHDTLFESTMCLLDALSGKEQAISNLLNDLPLYPCWIYTLDTVLTPWSHQVFEKAGFETNGPIYYAKRTVYKGFIGFTLKTWCHDKTPDKAATMAYVDETLTVLKDTLHKIPMPINLW